ncbi:MAG: Ryanodine receptor Ryr, partial [Armatimonadetes bacterium]|nr:Ryanodine receptor Ryr [Armatimonadota bacterium]
MPYQPQPLDTSAVTLPAELAALTEYLAENAHDLW